jgi:hypothetical protein
MNDNIDYKKLIPYLVRADYRFYLDGADTINLIGGCTCSLLYILMCIATFVGSTNLFKGFWITFGIVVFLYFLVRISWFILSYEVIKEYAQCKSRSTEISGADWKGYEELARERE